MGGDTAAPQTNRSRRAGARAARHADALPHRGRRLELLPRGAGDINAPDPAERTRRSSPPPVCTAADGAVEHASLGAARRARGGKAPEGFGAYTASMHMRQDATHVVALRAVEHAASPILKAGFCG